eukprot:Rhum_TRINITY_DN15056_c5_g2::Rhum_TRINITY_DN15056_c5_g2_i1::g.135349::m.135349
MRPLRVIGRLPLRRPPRTLVRHTAASAAATAASGPLLRGRSRGPTAPVLVRLRVAALGQRVGERVDLRLRGDADGAALLVRAAPVLLLVFELGAALDEALGLLRVLEEVEEQRVTQPRRRLVVGQQRRHVGVVPQLAHHLLVELPDVLRVELLQVPLQPLEERLTRLQHVVQPPQLLHRGRLRPRRSRRARPAAARRVAAAAAAAAAAAEPLRGRLGRTVGQAGGRSRAHRRRAGGGGGSGGGGGGGRGGGGPRSCRERGRQGREASVAQHGQRRSGRRRVLRSVGGGGGGGGKGDKKHFGGGMSRSTMGSGLDGEGESAPQEYPAGQRHPLARQWHLQFRDRSVVCESTVFEDIVKAQFAHMADISTVEEFWSAYAHLCHPGDVKVNGDYLLFEKGVHPSWEDKHFANGSRVLIRLFNPKQTKTGQAEASAFWEEVLLAAIGEQWAVEKVVLGVNVTMRRKPKGTHYDFQIWLNVDDEETCQKLMDQCKVMVKPFQRNCLLNHLKVHYFRDEEVGGEAAEAAGEPGAGEPAGETAPEA